MSSISFGYSYLITERLTNSLARLKPFDTLKNPLGDPNGKLVLDANGNPITYRNTPYQREVGLLIIDGSDARLVTETERMINDYKKSNDYRNDPNFKTLIDKASVDYKNCVGAQDLQGVRALHDSVSKNGNWQQKDAALYEEYKTALASPEPSKLDKLYKNLTVDMTERQRLEWKKESVLSMMLSQSASSQRGIIAGANLSQAEFNQYATAKPKKRSLTQSAKNYGLMAAYAVPAAANFLGNTLKAVFDMPTLWEGLKGQSWAEYRENFRDIKRGDLQHQFVMNAAAATRGTLAQIVPLPFMKPLNVSKLNR